ncbi:MAG TPA: GlsB/YeaQ/YmgE family stress response membrane protein [Paracoccaceae bacterium]|nr:GlsB/YeaQ/YmgE family stress response membrane protein [Paracoccaceae bacterium]
MRILALVIIGAAAGFIATRLMRLDLGLVETVAVGILGAIVGGLILEFLLAAFGFLSGFAGAVLGAMLLIWLYKTFLAGKL